MIRVEVWLYGPLARYAGEQSQGTFAQLEMDFPDGAAVRDILERLSIPVEEKGITFINGQLTDMPGLSADLDRELEEGDRVGLFHTKSMWPFQYRNGAAMGPELKEAMRRRGGGLHHSYT